MFSPSPRLFLACLAVLGCDAGSVTGIGGEPPQQFADARPLAAGVTITDVAAYQAVRIPLVENERVVATSQRSAPIVTGRELLVRATLQRDSQAGDRARVLRLDLAPTEGSAPSSYAEVEVEFVGDRADVRLLVAGADVRAGTSFALSVLDAKTDAPAGDVSGARWPAEPGSVQPLDARSSAAIRVVVVPIAYNGVAAPPVPASAMAGLVQALYPIADGAVTVTTASPLSLTVDLTAESSLFPSGHPYWMSDEIFAELHALRNQAGDGVYYYGYLEHATLFGMAQALPSWVAMGTTNDGIITFAHELGHNLGLRHGPCGGAAGADPAFPHAEASIGVEGYDPRSQQFLSPATYRDFMSYCSPEWVSDYHFRRMQSILSPTLRMAPGAVQASPVACDFVRP